MSYQNTKEYRAQGGAGTFHLTGDFQWEGRTVRDINFVPNDRRMEEQGICRVFSSRADAEIIFRALIAR